MLSEWFGPGAIGSILVLVVIIVFGILAVLWNESVREREINRLKEENEKLETKLYSKK